MQWRHGLGLCLATVVWCAALGSAPRARCEEGAAVPALGARVQDLRVYPTARRLVPYGMRRYGTTFPAAATRFLAWELLLRQSADAPKRDFTLRVVCRRSDDTVLFEQSLDSVTVPGEDLSPYSLGWGSDAVGAWEPDTYSLAATINGDAVARTTFTVTGALQGGDTAGALEGRRYDIPSLKARVTHLRFFESDGNALPCERRRFAERFVRGETRYINWCLELVHPAPGTHVDVDIRAVWYRPSGIVLARQTCRTGIGAQWTNSNHAKGWGSPEPWAFPVGTYRVELFVDDEQVASGTFEMVR